MMRCRWTASRSRRRAAFLAWDCGKPMIERVGRLSVLHFQTVVGPAFVVGFSERLGSAIQGGVAGGLRR